jgi:choline dehydrogenase-like flavoprotein
MVKEILTNGKARATGISYFDHDNRLREQPADIVIIAGSAVESARLLLNSKSLLFPNGIGNRYDWVGRNLQGHAYTGAMGLFDFEVFDDLGPGASIAICDYNHGNSGLVGGALLCNEFIRLPIHFSGMIPPELPRWGEAHKDYMRKYYRRSSIIMGPVQELPVFDARVQVDPVIRDYWGIPVARLSGHRHPSDIATAKYIAEKAERWLKEAGAIQTWPRLPGPELSGGQHQAGTCRMGNDPHTSVVDRDCRVHDVENLFIADGSVHVTNGGFNPVLTIMANAYRVGEHIAKNWKSI